MKVAFYTLGCKVNQNETGALAQLFYENGFEPAPDGGEADVYIVNSCTVTAGGDKKSRQWLRRAKRRNPGAVTVLTGCFPQAFPGEALAVEEADIITGSGARRRVLDNVLRFLQEGGRIVDIAPHEKSERFEELPMERLEGHTRAFMKIEDGCNRRCAYCVIPRARGSVRSRAEESILGELAALAKGGYAEVVFSGINLSSYGRDTGTDLAEIVEKAAQVPGIRRIRLGSPHGTRSGFVPPIPPFAAKRLRRYAAAHAPHLRHRGLSRSGGKAAGRVPGRVFHHGHHRGVSRRDRGGF